eukprot:CAMPEP_0170601690 /NCGR_PEP_ID=MMETSP0224-20130122/17994_1 /TAXON_ID=285029 /ORGANISM="Togula jolla, Strain CCCM 725" /LENGTH=318 /DNA_ID=CAMNT_0010926483 /DNA_START=78 /DNA_END=1034 /DNA_ORIENTATION=-
MTWLLSAQGFMHSRQPNQSSCPSIFVAVFSRANDVARRRLVRNMWAHGEGWPNMIAKFVVCGNGHCDNMLRREREKYGDVMVLECKEGYGKGLLTAKLLASMRAYQDTFNTDLFMKVDDDTFVYRRDLCSYIGQHLDQEPFQYMGVYHKAAAVNRDPLSIYREPASTYPNSTWPESMSGGAGYILSGQLVRHLLASGIPQSNFMWNEDKAVGVWVHLARQAGARIKLLKIQGSDGFRTAPFCGKWKHYPWLLHHKLSAETIACLDELARADDPEKRSQCWSGAARRFRGGKAQTVCVDKYHPLWLEGAPLNRSVEPLR